MAKDTKMVRLTPKRKGKWGASLLLNFPDDTDIGLDLCEDSLPDLFYRVHQVLGSEPTFTSFMLTVAPRNPITKK